MILVFASNNEHKLKEIQDVLGNSFILKSLTDIDFIEEIPEEEPTIEGNALFKARYIFNATGMNVFADDTGLEIEALDGRPGVHSARFAGPGKNSSDNIDKVLSLLADERNRKARFRTVIALILYNEEYLFEGIINGSITLSRRGDKGFGYDPVFIPDGTNRTFAEMELSEKNMISHRSIAFGKLKEFLFHYPARDNKGAI
jgi:XTP/dITP diphosphohydrolase